MRKLAFIAIVVGACAGEAPTNPNNPDAGSDPDAAPEVGHRVSGKTLDYFTQMPLPMSNVTTDGIMPAKMATSIADGTYEFAVIAPNSKVFLSVARTNYRTTRNIVTSVIEAPVTQDIYVMSVADLNRQYVTAGVAGGGAGKAFLAAELRDTANQPLVGIAKTAIELLDMNDVVVPNPIVHFFGAQGDINPAITTSETNAGKSRVAILDVPPGAYKLKVSYPDGVGGTAVSIVAFTAAADGAVLSIAGGPLPNQGALDPKFASEVYPRVQRAANGGIGCANCHTANGSAAILVLDAGATQSLANIMARPNVIDATTPANSLLLTKPLYEQPPALQNHPNATFLDVNDPDYKLILRWIQNGAKP